MGRFVNRVSDQPTALMGIAMTTLEHRRHERIDLTDASHELVLHVQQDTGLTLQRTVRPHDLSRNGMAFMDERPMNTGTRCIMLLRHKGSSLRVIGKVVHARPDGQGQYLIGLKFTTIMTVPGDTPGLMLTNHPAVGQLLIHL